MTPSDWPFFDILITTRRLGMRLPREADVPSLIDAAKSGIHHPDTMPFSEPWTDAPSPEFERNFYQWYWRQGARTTPESWSLPFMVSVDGRAIGVQHILADRFSVMKVVQTGSWLRQDAQGSGYGKAMRAAVLFLAFDGLGADVAASGSNLDNHSSIGVSRALGYEEDGYARHAPRDEPLDLIRWRLTRERFEKLRAGGHYGRWEPVTIEGLDPCLPLLGVS